MERSDAAAIQSARARVSGMNATLPGGISVQVLAVADANVREASDEGKPKLYDILSIKYCQKNLCILLN